MSLQPLDPDFSSYEIWTRRNDPSMAKAFTALLNEVLRNIESHRGYSMLRRDVDPEDLAHEVMRRAFTDERLQSGAFVSRGVGSLRAYLRELVHSEITDRIRARDTLKRGQNHTIVPLDGDTPTGSAIPEARSLDPSPTEIALAKDLEESLLARLPQREREVWVLRVRDGLEFEAIAGRLGLVSDSAARGLFDRARTRLQSGD